MSTTGDSLLDYLNSKESITSGMSMRVPEETHTCICDPSEEKSLPQECYHPKGWGPCQNKHADI